MADHTTPHHQHTNPLPFLASMGLLLGFFGLLPVLYGLPIGWMLLIMGIGMLLIAVGAWLVTMAKEQIKVAKEEVVPEHKKLGIWFVGFMILSELFLFGALFACYFYLHNKDFVFTQSWLNFFMVEGKVFNVMGPVVILNTVLLVSSSVTLHFAEIALKKGKTAIFRILMSATLLMGVAFVGGQVFEYIEFILHENFSILSGPFGTTFFALTGLHGAHVIVGVIILSTLFAGSFFGQFSKKHHEALTVGSIYWHFVDVVWLFLVAVLYLRVI